MSEKLQDYYRVYFHSSDIYSPLFDIHGLMRELKVSLLHVPSESNLDISIEPYQMTKTQFINRDPKLKNYTGRGTEH